MYNYDEFAHFLIFEIQFLVCCEKEEDPDPDPCVNYSRDGKGICQFWSI